MERLREKESFKMRVEDAVIRSTSGRGSEDQIITMEKSWMMTMDHNHNMNLYSATYKAGQWR